MTGFWWSCCTRVVSVSQCRNAGVVGARGRRECIENQVWILFRQVSALGGSYFRISGASGGTMCVSSCGGVRRVLGMPFAFA